MGYANQNEDGNSIVIGDDTGESPNGQKTITLASCSQAENADLGRGSPESASNASTDSQQSCGAQ
ncbi:MAG: hypothetical protein PHH11_09455 [Methylomonas sp.]|nr:hypothetical protein [Methylomonas sp.]